MPRGCVGNMAGWEWSTRKRQSNELASPTPTLSPVFVGSGNQTQGFMNVKQVIYHCATPPVLADSFM